MYLLQAFTGHCGIVSSLCFREGTAELFSGSYDGTLSIWNAEHRTYIESCFGHQSELLSIDALGRERVLSVGRDRTMQLYKVGIVVCLICLSISKHDFCFLSGSRVYSVDLSSFRIKF